jgi:hypothetical protein
MDVKIGVRTIRPVVPIWLIDMQRRQLAAAVAAAEAERQRLNAFLLLGSGFK